MVRALLFGGGGVTHGEDPMLEDFLITLLPASPLVGYIGFANDDDPVRLERMIKRFHKLGAAVLPLPQTASAKDAERWAAQLNAIYVSGGHTANMICHWRKSGIDAVLFAAAKRGVLLSGVSAGAVAWFDYAFWDGNGEGFRPLKGLGLLKGSCCPHFTTEPERAIAYRKYIIQDLLPAGFAIGDGAGLFIDNTKSPKMILARRDTGVWRIENIGQNLKLTTLTEITL